MDLLIKLLVGGLIDRSNRGTARYIGISVSGLLIVLYNMLHEIRNQCSARCVDGSDSLILADR